MTSVVGMRVLRGPNWQSGDADGGEGRLGTLKALLGDGRVRVLWDSGKESVCKAGADGKYELRILDTAQVGVRHNGSRCAECGERDVFGMLWRCLDSACLDVTLCSLCYVMDKHNIKHPFERIDTEGGCGVKVKKRTVSLKIRAMGIFPGAKVIRGPDWIWGDQDGGPGSVGVVVGYENVAPSSSRNMVRVEWSSTSKLNSYRVGFQGNMDIVYTDEAPGTYYYRDHLPVVDTAGSFTVSSSSLSSTSSSSSSVSTPRDASATGAGGAGQGAERAADGDTLKAGDKVVIGVSEDKLKALQSNFGGVTTGMIQSIGKKGEVMSVTATGAIKVQFGQISYRFNPATLVKDRQVNVGDTVRICSDLERAKALNKLVGWKPVMDEVSGYLTNETCGKVGKVVKVDEDGDAAVVFGRRIHMYAPACCQSAAGSSPDNLNPAPSGNPQGSSSPRNDDQNLHHKVMQMLAQLQTQDSGSGGDGSGGDHGGDDVEMQQLISAINRGDAGVVKAACMADKSLLRRLHKGMTLLIVASHEGRRDVINDLLDLGADIDQKDDAGNTALGAALEGKKQPIALMLLQKGASVRSVNCKGRNPMHAAAYNNMGEALKEIIRKGGDVNVTDKYGDAPLHDAIQKNSEDAVNILVDTPSVDLMLGNGRGFNMLQLACLRGNVHALERILQRDTTGINKLMKGQFNALQIAVTNDHVECARLLIVEGKAALDVRGQQGLTALHLSCLEAYPRCVELLLRYDADHSLTADDGNTALHLAVGTTSTQLKKNPSDDLERAEHRNRVRMACMLLEKGALFNVKNHNGAEPLQTCRPDYIRNGVLKFVKENPELIKRTERGEKSNAEVKAALKSLLEGQAEATQKQLQEQCKQS